VTATVILPTFRRREALRRVLRALRELEEPGMSWELVVLDNDDPPGAESVFVAEAASLNVAARYVREPRRGSAHARNRGIAEASGTITVMLDDDVVPARDWLRVLLSPIVAGRCEGTGGRVELDPSVKRPRWLHDSLEPYLGRWDLGGPERPLTPRENIVTSNCAFRTDLLRTTGGFDPELGPRGRTPMVNDDALLTRRFLAAGGRVRWVPEAVVVHELPPGRLRRRYLMRRAFAQGRSDWILDRDAYLARKFGGARVAASWLGAEVRRRGSEGVVRPEVAFHLVCDVVRTAGAMWGAASLWRRQRNVAGR
jgi:glycosyltransferase involved in cell wall biosynthesis